MIFQFSTHWIPINNQHSAAIWSFIAIVAIVLHHSPEYFPAGNEWYDNLWWWTFGGFPSHRGLVIIQLNWIFHYKPSILWVPPWRAGSPPYTTNITCISSIFPISLLYYYTIYGYPHLWKPPIYQHQFRRKSPWIGRGLWLETTPVSHRDQSLRLFRQRVPGIDADPMAEMFRVFLMEKK